MKEFSQYDKRNYKTLSVIEGYGKWSKTYDLDRVPVWMTTRMCNKLEIIKWDKLNQVVELSCGTGKFGQYLKSKGVSHLDGVDITPEMIELAKEKSCYDNLFLEDIRKTSLESEKYDELLEKANMGWFKRLINAIRR